MEDVYITLQQAADFEGLKYEGMRSRIKRDSQLYKVKYQSREIGGKDEVMVAVSSLSAKARKAWRAAQKINGRDVIISKTGEVRP